MRERELACFAFLRDEMLNISGKSNLNFLIGNPPLSMAFRESAEYQRCPISYFCLSWLYFVFQSLLVCVFITTVRLKQPSKLQSTSGHLNCCSMENLWRGRDIPYHTFLSKYFDLQLETRKCFTWVFFKIVVLEDYLLGCGNLVLIRKLAMWRMCEEGGFLLFVRFLFYAWAFLTYFSRVPELLLAFWKWFFSKTTGWIVTIQCLFKYLQYGKSSPGTHCFFAALQIFLTCILKELISFRKVFLEDSNCVTPIQFLLKGWQCGKFAKQQASSFSYVWYSSNELFWLVFVIRMF